MPIEPEFLELMDQTIQWEAAQTIDAYGKRAHKAPVAIPCHIQGKATEVTGPDGTVTTAAGVAWLGGVYPDISLADRIQLPEGGKRGVVEVSTIYDEDGPHHTRIAYGQN